MTTATHDTAAALKAVLAAIDSDTHDGRAVSLSDHAALHRAITAHVEAEVARRLAPNLELWRWKCHDETVEQAIERLVRERNEYAEKLCERNAALVMAPDVEAAIAQIVACTDLMDNAGSARAREALRAAIAADKARAVAAAHEGMRRVYADRMLARDREAMDALAALDEERSARPTPDEARRLVNILVGTVIGDQMDSTPTSRAAAKEAVADVLRALGVEA